MATLNDFTDLQEHPTDKVKADRLHRLLVEAEGALRLAIFGDRQGAIDAHDHGPRGGRNVLRGLFALCFGPYARPGSGGAATRGIPLLPPLSGTSFVTTPKLVVCSGVYLPGGANAVAVRLAGHLPGAGTRTVNLKVELRSFFEAGYGPGAAHGLTAQATLTATGASDYQDVRVQIAPLASLGNPNANRWLELAIWQVSNPPAASAYRLLAAAGQWVATTTPPLSSLGLSPVAVSVAEIQAGAPLTEQLLRKGKAILNNLIYAALGRVPGKILSWGLAGEIEDKSSSYRKVIKRRHQHTGMSEVDGAVIPATYAAGSYALDLGDTATPEASKQIVIGHQIDPSGAGALNTLTKFALRVPVPKGCRRLEARFAVLCDHFSTLGALTAFARGTIVAHESQTPVNIVTGLASGDESSSIGEATYASIEVDPEDGAPWRRNAERVIAGKASHWTNDALLPTPPSGAQSGVFFYRISQSLFVNVSPTDTKDIDLEFAFKLVNSAGSSVSSAFLQWLTVVPASGS